MREGFYKVDYQGLFGLGVAVVALDTGIVAGADMMGGIYDGRYVWNERTQLLDVELSVQIPGGVHIVQGKVAPPEGMQIEVECSFPREPDNMPVAAVTSEGPVGVRVHFLRNFP